MAEIGFFESMIDDIHDWTTTSSELQNYDEKMNGINKSLVDGDYGNFTKEQLESQRQTLQNMIVEGTEKRIALDSTIRTKMNAYKSSLGDKLDIPPETINYNASYNDWNSKIQTDFEEKVSNVVDGIQEIQAANDEDGKSLEDSPKTIGKLRKLFKNPFTWIFVSGFLAGAVNLVITEGDDYHNWLTSKGGIQKYTSIGCYQYHIPTGSIRTLGVCGVTDICNTYKTKDTCEKGNGVKNFCFWNGKTCGAGKASVAADSCCRVCKKDADCQSSDTTCSNDGDCPVGSCVNGKCQDQKCDSVSGTCTPCPSSNPKFSLGEQIQKGNIGFCLAGDPPSACPTASLLCQTTDQGGACKACASNDQSCINPGGTHIISNCMCNNTSANGNGWITNPVCGSADSIVIMLSYLNQIKDTWVPEKTPIIVWIITGLGILSILIVLIWYVRYLIKKGKSMNS